MQDTNSSIALRIRSHWRIKVFLGGAIIFAFWILYFSIQHHPIFTITELTPSFIDHLIPFNPGYVYTYESFWLLMPIAPWLMDSRRDLLSYCKAISVMSLIAFSLFFLWPTACARPAGPASGNDVYKMLITIDRELNAFPSLHAAFTVFSALCCWDIFKTLSFHRMAICLILLWTLAILYATLATHQHLFVDLVGGTLLALACYGYFVHEKRSGNGA